MKARSHKDIEYPNGFPYEEWASRREAFVNDLRERICGKTIALWRNVGLGKAGATAEREAGEAETAHGNIRFHREEDAKGSFRARFASHALPLEGCEIRLRTGGFERSVELRTVAPDQVGAEVMIQREERSRWPEGAVLEVCLFPIHIRRSPHPQGIEGRAGTTERRRDG